MVQEYNVQHRLHDTGVRSTMSFIVNAVKGLRLCKIQPCVLIAVFSNIVPFTAGQWMKTSPKVRKWIINIGPPSSNVKWLALFYLPPQRTPSAWVSVWVHSVHTVGEQHPTSLSLIRSFICTSPDGTNWLLAVLMTPVVRWISGEIDLPRGCIICECRSSVPCQRNTATCIALFFSGPTADLMVPRPSTERMPLPPIGLLAYNCRMFSYYELHAQNSKTAIHTMSCADNIQL